MRPWYSATLLVVAPIPSARSASTSPDLASSTTAPYPAGPGLPREPPSASMMTSRLTGPPRCRRTPPSRTLSQAGLRRADQDGAALVAGEHLVVGGRRDPGQQTTVQLQPAGPAPAGPQQGRADPLGRAHPVVQRQQRFGQPGDQRRPLGRPPRLGG